jgi:hypothetical protein
MKPLTSSNNPLLYLCPLSCHRGPKVLFLVCAALRNLEQCLFTDISIMMCEGLANRNLCNERPINKRQFEQSTSLYRKGAF